SCGPLSAPPEGGTKNVARALAETPSRRQDSRRPREIPRRDTDKLDAITPGPASWRFLARGAGALAGGCAPPTAPGRTPHSRSAAPRAAIDPADEAAGGFSEHGRLGEEAQHEEAGLR